MDRKRERTVRQPRRERGAVERAGCHVRRVAERPAAGGGRTLLPSPFGGCAMQLIESDRLDTQVVTGDAQEMPVSDLEDLEAFGCQNTTPKASIGVENQPG